MTESRDINKHTVLLLMSTVKDAVHEQRSESASMYINYWVNSKKLNDIIMIIMSSRMTTALCVHVNDEEKCLGSVSSEHKKGRNLDNDSFFRLLISSSTSSWSAFITTLVLLHFTASKKKKK